MKNLQLAILSNGEGLYVVEKGETIKSLSLKFSTTENLIITDNNLVSEVLEGDRIYIKSYKKIYTCTLEDNIEKIAKKFNVTCDDILKVNKTPYIYVGERIVIP